MDVLPYAFPSLESRSLRSIKHEERKKGQREHAGETEEKCTKFRVLAMGGRICPSCCVEEPYRGIDADPVTPLAICVYLETVDN